MNVLKTGVVKNDSSSIHTIINNPCETGTSTNWTFGGSASISTGLVQLTGVNPGINSSSFDLGPNDIIVFEFGVSLPTPSTTTSGPGLYLGTTYNVNTKTYYHNGTNWVVASNGTTNPYFIHAYNSTAINHVKTYIIGSSVDINKVPRTESTVGGYTILALQPLSGTSTKIRDGYNSNTSMVINIYDLKLYKLNYCGICENDGEASFGKGYLSFDNYIEI